MSIVPLPLPPDVEAQALLRRFASCWSTSTSVRRDSTGRMIIHLAVSPWTLERVLAFDTGAEDIEDSDSEPEADAEPDDDDAEIDGPAAPLDLVPPRRFYRGRQ